MNRFETTSINSSSSTYIRDQDILTQSSLSRLGIRSCVSALVLQFVNRYLVIPPSATEGYGLIPTQYIICASYCYHDISIVIVKHYEKGQSRIVSAS
jgi:hypothetical protein